MRGWKIEDGRWNGAKDGSYHLPFSILYPRFSSQRLFNFEPVILNDRVAQKLVRRVVQRLLRGGLVRAGSEVNLDVFPDVNGDNALVTHLFEGVLDSFALWIKHGLFRSDDDFCFHSRAWNVAKKSTAGRAIFDSRATALNLPAVWAIV
jgi:hypothetical protein